MRTQRKTDVYVLTTISELQNIIANHKASDGMFVYVKVTKNHGAKTYAKYRLYNLYAHNVTPEVKA